MHTTTSLFFAMVNGDFTSPSYQYGTVPYLQPQLSSVLRYHFDQSKLTASCPFNDDTEWINFEEEEKEVGG